MEVLEKGKTDKERKRENKKSTTNQRKSSGKFCVVVGHSCYWSSESDEESCWQTQLHCLLVHPLQHLGRREWVRERRERGRGNSEKQPGEYGCWLTKRERPTIKSNTKRGHVTYLFVCHSQVEVRRKVGISRYLPRAPHPFVHSKPQHLFKACCGQKEVVTRSQGENDTTIRDTKKSSDSNTTVRW